MEPNNNFVAQSGDIEALKKTRASKKKTDEAIKDLKGMPADENTPVLQGDFVEIQLAKYDLAQEVIDGWKKDFLALKITDVNDKEQMTKVVDAHRIVKSTRVGVEKKRKELKEDSLRFGRMVDNEARRLTALIEPIETYLEEQKNIVEIEREKVRVAKEEQMKLRMQERTTILLGFGMVFDGQTFTLQEGEEKLSIDALDVKMGDDVQFNILQLKGEILHEKSKIRIAAEQEAARIESERVAAIAAQQKEEADRLAKQAAELKAAQDALDKQKRDMEIAEEKRLAVAKAEADAKIKAEKEKEEALAAAEKRRLDDIAATEAKHKAEIAAKIKAEEDRIATEKKIAEEKLAAEIAKKEAEARAHALLPDKNKLVEFATFVEEISLPAVNSEAAIAIVNTIKESLTKLSAWTLKQSETLK